jgi:hypothetical protein
MTTCHQHVMQQTIIRCATNALHYECTIKGQKQHTCLMMSFSAMTICGCMLSTSITITHKRAPNKQTIIRCVMKA